MSDWQEGEEKPTGKLRLKKSGASYILQQEWKVVSRGHEAKIVWRKLPVVESGEPDEYPVR